MTIDRVRRIKRKLISRILSAYYSWIYGSKLNVYGAFCVKAPERVKFGSNCYINYGVFILGQSGVAVGNNVTLSARCMLMDAGLDLKAKVRAHIGGEIIINDNAWIGAGAIILAGTKIGEGAVVGAGSVVTRDVAAYTIVAGNPAKEIGAVS